MLQGHDRFLWSNKAHFHLNGGVYTRNYHIWAANNLHACVQKALSNLSQRHLLSYALKNNINVIF